MFKYSKSKEIGVWLETFHFGEGDPSRHSTLAGESELGRSSTGGTGNGIQVCVFRLCWECSKSEKEYEKKVVEFVNEYMNKEGAKKWSLLRIVFVYISRVLTYDSSSLQHYSSFLSHQHNLGWMPRNTDSLTEPKCIRNAYSSYAAVHWLLVYPNLCREKYWHASSRMRWCESYDCFISHSFFTLWNKLLAVPRRASSVIWWRT